MPPCNFSKLTLKTSRSAVLWFRKFSLLCRYRVGYVRDWILLSQIGDYSDHFWAKSLIRSTSITYVPPLNRSLRDHTEWPGRVWAVYPDPFSNAKISIDRPGNSCLQGALGNCTCEEPQRKYRSRLHYLANKQWCKWALDQNRMQHFGRGLLASGIPCRYNTATRS